MIDKHILEAAIIDKHKLEAAIRLYKEEAELFKKSAEYYKSEEGEDSPKAMLNYERVEDTNQLVAWLSELLSYRERKTCETCKHKNNSGDEFPCLCCITPYFGKWE